MGAGLLGVAGVVLGCGVTGVTFGATGFVVLGSTE